MKLNKESLSDIKEKTMKIAGKAFEKAKVEVPKAVKVATDKTKVFVEDVTAAVKHAKKIRGSDNGWFRLEDGMPAPGKYLVVHRDYPGGRMVDIARFMGNLPDLEKYDYEGVKYKGFYSDNGVNGYRSLATVSHWMPMPDLPKEG